MSTDRRFSEEEVAFILERAAKAESAQPESESDSRALVPGSDDGMTLARLQEIAAEVGLSAQAVDAAARAVARGDLAPTQQRTFVGLPVAVGRTITIDRPVTDAEWERMVVAFRETFNARGKSGRDGGLRHWSNGNLHAMLEPTATGHRLRLQTTKGDARLMLGMGAGALFMASAVAIPNLVATNPVPLMAWLGPTIIAAFGVFMAGRTALTLNPWARTRSEQMERLAEDVTRILDETPATPTLPRTP